MMKDVLLTLDVDWAPDFVVDHVVRILLEAGVKSTWFITHDMAPLRDLKAENGLIELGLHPNLQNNSTQGRNLDEVMDYLRSLVPDAQAVRMHGLVQSTEIFRRFVSDHGISVDVSLFLPLAPYLSPHCFALSKGMTITRVPFFWEDDVAMYAGGPWTVEELLAAAPQGLKVLNFHPIHIYLNSISFDNYVASKGSWCDRKALERFVNRTERGAGDMFRDCVEMLAASGHSGQTISELVHDIRPQLWRTGLSRES